MDVSFLHRPDSPHLCVPLSRSDLAPEDMSGIIRRLCVCHVDVRDICLHGLVRCLVRGSCPLLARFSVRRLGELPTQAQLSEPADALVVRQGLVSDVKVGAAESGLDAEVQDVEVSGEGLGFAQPEPDELVGVGTSGPLEGIPVGVAQVQGGSVLVGLVRLSHGALCLDGTPLNDGPAFAVGIVDGRDGGSISGILDLCKVDRIVGEIDGIAGEVDDTTLVAGRDTATGKQASSRALRYSHVAEHGGKLAMVAC
ncbi:hypothetical protein PG984_007750 [Apiospora sp. TS-2023a]